MTLLVPLWHKYFLLRNSRHPIEVTSFDNEDFMKALLKIEVSWRIEIPRDEKRRIRQSRKCFDCTFIQDTVKRTFFMHYPQEILFAFIKD